VLHTDDGNWNAPAHRLDFRKISYFAWSSPPGRHHSRRRYARKSARKSFCADSFEAGLSRPAPHPLDRSLYLKARLRQCGDVAGFIPSHPLEILKALRRSRGLAAHPFESRRRMWALAGATVPEKPRMLACADWCVHVRDLTSVVVEQLQSGPQYVEDPRHRSEVSAALLPRTWCTTSLPRKNLLLSAGCTNAKCRGRVEKTLHEVGLFERRDSLVRSFSRGNASTRGIARALCMSPPSAARRAKRARPKASMAGGHTPAAAATWLHIHEPPRRIGISMLAIARFASTRLSRRHAHRCGSALHLDLRRRLMSLLSSTTALLGKDSARSFAAGMRPPRCLI